MFNLVKPLSLHGEPQKSYTLLTPAAADLQKKVDALRIGQCLRIDAYGRADVLFQTGLTVAPGNVRAVELSAEFGINDPDKVLQELKLDVLVCTEFNNVEMFDLSSWKPFNALYVQGDRLNVRHISVPEGTTVHVDLQTLAEPWLTIRYYDMMGQLSGVEHRASQMPEESSDAGSADNQLGDMSVRSSKKETKHDSNASFDSSEPPMQEIEAGDELVVLVGSFKLEENGDTDQN
jgi:hypothetical protein